MFAVWGEKYLTDISEMDEHHEKLVDIVNRLYSSVFECESLEREHELTGIILQELLDYTSYHFAAEEQLLQQYEYPDIAEQIDGHKVFINKLNGLLVLHRQGVQALSFPTFEFLRDWLINHIAGVDKKFGPYLVSKGVR